MSLSPDKTFRCVSMRHVHVVSWYRQPLLYGEIRTPLVSAGPATKSRPCPCLAADNPSLPLPCFIDVVLPLEDYVPGVLVMTT